LLGAEEFPKYASKKAVSMLKLASAGLSVFEALGGREGGPFNARNVKESTAWNWTDTKRVENEKRVIERNAGCKQAGLVAGAQDHQTTAVDRGVRVRFDHQIRNILNRRTYWLKYSTKRNFRFQ
jgi:hypothetical protein